MKPLTRYGMVLALTGLLGCVAPTGYTPAVGRRGGFREEKVDDSHYVVSFDGNGKTSKDRVWNFWIYRCAELTKEKGFTYFVLDIPEARKQSRHRDRDESPYQRASYVSPAPAAGGHGAPVYIYVPAQRITTWHSKAAIAMYGDNVPGRVLLMRAQTVLDLLDPYVKSNGEAPAPNRESVIKQSACMLGPGFSVTNPFASELDRSTAKPQ